MVMRRSLILAFPIFASLGLAGCETSDAFDSVTEKMQNFNPFGTAKTPLKGQRQAVFPDGVPGVQQGVPRELIVGTPENIAENTPLPPEPKVEEKPKPTRRAARSAPASSPQRTTTRQRPRPQRGTEPPQQAARPPAGASGRSAWESVPTTPGPARAPAAQPAQPAANAGWPSPQASQPVPTIWPDPPTATR